MSTAVLTNKDSLINVLACTSKCVTVEALCQVTKMTASALAVDASCCLVAKGGGIIANVCSRQLWV